MDKRVLVIFFHQLLFFTILSLNALGDGKSIDLLRYYKTKIPFLDESVKNKASTREMIFL